MKTAMQQKDSNRLSVLRALLSQTLNASKTSQPINTDMQMLSLLRKSSNAARDAAEEFKRAGRQDLADKEDSQRVILEEYAGTVNVLGEEEIREVVVKMVGQMREALGKELEGVDEEKRQKKLFVDVLKRVLEGFEVGGQAVEKGMVVNIVREALKS